MKTLLRILALFSLAMALITAVLDVTRSIADSTLVFTSLGVDWARFSLESLTRTQSIVQEFIHPVLWDPVVIKILQAPSWAVFTALWLIFALLGNRKKARWQDNYTE